jgi:hypothetical protein
MSKQEIANVTYVSGLVKERPSASEMLKKLEWLTGTWNVTGEYYTSEGNRFPDRHAIFAFKWICGGMFLQWEMQSHGPLKFYESHALIRWDDAAQVYRGNWFDNFGTVDSTVMTWQDDNTLLMKYDRGFVFLDPGVKQLRLTLSRSSERQCRWLLEVLMEGTSSFQTLIDQRGEKIY